MPAIKAPSGGYPKYQNFETARRGCFYSMDETLLKMRVEKTLPTVRIMDEFESVDDAFRKKYASLELCDLFCIKYRRRMYGISLIVQRRPKKQPCIHHQISGEVEDQSGNGQAEAGGYSTPRRPGYPTEPGASQLSGACPYLSTNA